MKPHNWKGGKTKNADGYVLILRPGHPGTTKHGYVYKHRLVMEKHLGRILTSEEVVHHRNDNKQDNRLRNLKLTNHRDHGRHHNPKGAQKPRTRACESRVLQLRASGMLVRKIAVTVGLSVTTVLRILAKHPIRCGFCGREFKRQKALGMHVTRAHTPSRLRRVS